MENLIDRRIMKIAGINVECGRTSVAVTTQFADDIKTVRDEYAAKDIDAMTYLERSAKCLVHVVRHQIDYPDFRSRVRAYLLTPRRILKKIPAGEFSKVMDEVTDEVFGADKKKEMLAMENINRSVWRALGKLSPSQLDEFCTNLPSMVSEVLGKSQGDIQSAS